ALFSIMAIAFRISNPLHVAPNEWYHASVGSIVSPFGTGHGITSLLVQSTIAILILVGFESCTALAAESKNPRRDIPRGVILSLIIQGLFAYLFEYFASNYALIQSGQNAFGGASGPGGIQAMAASGAPLGDQIKQIAGAFFGSNVAFILMIIVAVT